MVQEPPLAPGRARAGEIERPQPVRRRVRSRSTLTTLGSSFSSSRVIGVASVAMSTAGSASGARQARTTAASMVGRSPWMLTTTSWTPVGVDSAQRLENAVGAGRVIGAGHDRLARRPSRPPRHARIVRRHPDRPDIGLHRPAPDVHDHRLAVDVGERLSGQTRRAMRAGMRTMGLAIRFDSRQIRERPRLIRVAKARAKRLIKSAKTAPEAHSSRRKSRSSWTT